MALKRKISKKFLEKLNQSKASSIDKIYVIFLIKITLSVWVIGALVFGFYTVYSSLVYGQTETPPIGFLVVILGLHILFSLAMLVGGLKWYFNRRFPLARFFITNNVLAILISAIFFNVVFRDFVPFIFANIHLFITIMLICLGILVSVVFLTIFSKPINAKKIEPSLNVSFTGKVVPAFIFSILFFFMLVRGFSYKEGIEYGVEYENTSHSMGLEQLSDAFGRLITEIEKDTGMLSELVGIARFSERGLFAINSRGHAEAVKHYIDFIFSEKSVSGRYLEALDIHITNPRVLFGGGYRNTANYVGLALTKEDVLQKRDATVTLDAQSVGINNQILSRIRDNRETFVDIRYIGVGTSSFVVYAPMMLDNEFVGVMAFKLSDNTITDLVNTACSFTLDTGGNLDIVLLNEGYTLLYAYSQKFAPINEYLQQQRSSVAWSSALSERYIMTGDNNMSSVVTFEEDTTIFNVQKARPRNLNINIMSVWQTVMFKNRYNSVGVVEQSSIITIIALVVYSIIVYLLIAIHQNNLLKLGYSTSMLAQNGGDLRIRMSVHANDESSILAYGINRFLEKMTSIINTLKENISKMSIVFNNASDLITENYSMSDMAVTEFEKEVQIIEKVSGLITNASIVSNSQRKQFVSVNDSIGTLLETVTNINSSMETQATAISETSASIHEMMANISSVAQSAQKVNQFSKDLVSDAKNGNDIGEDVMEAIQHIKEASTQITDITRVIQLISEQTNLLAMNAAIEAAHAGEQGKGFAIVADKIRKLAEDTSENSKIISAIVQDVVDSVERTVVLAVQSSDAIEKILDSSTSVSSLIGEITNANSELDLGRRDILSVLKNLNQITFSVQNFSNEQTEISEKLNSQILSVDKLAVDVGYAVDSVNNETSELLQSIRSVSSLVVGSKEKIHSLEDTVNDARSIFDDVHSLINVFITEDEKEEDSSDDENDETNKKLK